MSMYVFSRILFYTIWYAAVGVMYLLSAVGYYRLLKKSDLRAWTAWFPLANRFTYYRMIWGNAALAVLTFVPVVRFVMQILSARKLRRAVGGKKALAVLAAFLPRVGVLVAGRKNIEYYGPYRHDGFWDVPERSRRTAAIIVWCVIALLLTTAYYQYEAEKWCARYTWDRLVGEAQLHGEAGGKITGSGEDGSYTLEISSYGTYVTIHMEKSRRNARNLYEYERSYLLEKEDAGAYTEYDGGRCAEFMADGDTAYGSVVLRGNAWAVIYPQYVSDENEEDYETLLYYLGFDVPERTEGSCETFTAGQYIS